MRLHAHVALHSALTNADTATGPSDGLESQPEPSKQCSGGLGNGQEQREAARPHPQMTARFEIGPLTIGLVDMGCSGDVGGAIL